MEAPNLPPPAKRTHRFVSPQGKQSGSLGWLSLRSYNYVIVIDHFLAYMHICRVYKKYTLVGDFDTPTHQPTNIYVYVYMKLNRLLFFKTGVKCYCTLSHRY